MTYITVVGGAAGNLLMAAALLISRPGIYKGY